jgi:hypothetical protein
MTLPDMEVLDVNIPVGGSLSLAPQEETFLGRCFWRRGWQMKVRPTFVCDLWEKHTPKIYWEDKCYRANWIAIYKLFPDCYGTGGIDFQRNAVNHMYPSPYVRGP